MKITMNGKQMEVEEGTTLLGLLDSKGLEPQRVVIEYNYDILNKELWDTLVLKENDHLEVLRFVGGG